MVQLFVPALKFSLNTVTGADELGEPEAVRLMVCPAQIAVALGVATNDAGDGFTVTVTLAELTDAQGVLDTTAR